MDAPKHETCSACGQPIRKLNPHAMDKTKVRVLEAIARYNDQGAVWVKVAADPATPPDEKYPLFVTDEVHVARLRWFGLLETREARSGLYRATSLGVAFLSGAESVPARIWCKAGEVVDQDPERLYIGQVRGVVYDKAYWNRYSVQQRFDQRRRQELPLFS